METVVQGDFHLDNANLLKAPGYAGVNATLHDATESAGGQAKRLSADLEVRNVFDTTYVGSAQDPSNSISGARSLQTTTAVLACITGSVSAAAPRITVGGMRLSF